MVRELREVAMGHSETAHLLKQELGLGDDDAAAFVITSYSIHYTKLYELVAQCHIRTHRGGSGRDHHVRHAAGGCRRITGRSICLCALRTVPVAYLASLYHERTDSSVGTDACRHRQRRWFPDQPLRAAVRAHGRRVALGVPRRLADRSP